MLCSVYSVIITVVMWLLPILMVSVLGHLSEGSCEDKKKPDDCAAGELPNSLGDPLFKIPTEKYKEVCERKLRVVKCIKDYVDNCMYGFSKSLFLSNYGGKLDAVEGVCTEGTNLSTGYHKHIECWERMVPDITYCNAKYEEVNIKLNNSTFEESGRGVVLSCCAFDWHDRCRRASAELRCSAEAKDVIDIVSNMTDNETIRSICSPEISDSANKCHGLYGVEETDFVAHFSSATVFRSSTFILLLCFGATKLNRLQIQISK